MPYPQPGDQAHLTWGSKRWSIARSMRIVCVMGGTSTQYDALLKGSDVVLTREQVRGFLPEAQWPANLNDHASWTLSGPNTLTAVVA